MTLIVLTVKDDVYSNVLRSESLKKFRLSISNEHIFVFHLNHLIQLVILN